TDQLRAQFHETETNRDAEIQPVEAFGITSEIDWRMHVVPLGVTVPAPGFRERIERTVMAVQPFPILALGGVAVTVHALRRAAVVRVLVPDVEAEGGGV